MCSLRPSLALVCFFLKVVFVHGKEEPSGVLTLTDENFDGAIERHKRVLVEFYAPWCGHCKNLEPEWNEASQLMGAEGLETRLAKVDATVETALSSRFEITGFPKLKYFVDGAELKEYEGERKAKAIFDWLRKQEEPAVKEISQEDVDKFFDETAEGQYALVAVVKKKSARAKAFFKVVQDGLSEYEFASFRFAVVWLPKAADPKTDAKLSMWRAGFDDSDGKKIEFTGSWTDFALSKWARVSLYPTIGKTFGKIYLRTAIEANDFEASVVAITDDDSAIDEDEDALRPRVMKILTPLVSKYPTWRFTSSEVSGMASNWAEQVGTSDPKIIVFADKKKYVLPGNEITDEGKVAAFLHDVSTKKAKPHYKSASPPASEVDSDAVTILTGNSFERHVLDAKKDAFVEFYAPWCGHCKKMAPEWQKLAEKVNVAGWGSKGVLIAKMDTTENECEEEVDGYPKLVLYPAVRQDKKMAKKQIYGGVREFAPMLDFLVENAKNLEGDEDPLAEVSGKKTASIVERERERKNKSKKSEF